MQDFLGFIKAYPAFVSIVAILFGIIGVFIGHWLNIGRDRRKEINTLVNLLRPVLLEERQRTSPNIPGLTENDFITFREALPIWKRCCFDMAAAKYKQSKNEDNQGRNSMGGVYFKNTEKIVHSVENLLKYMKKG